MQTQDMGQSLDLVLEFNETGKKILPRYCRGIVVNFRSISAPKMQGALIFLHVASGILKNYSQEAEKS